MLSLDLQLFADGPGGEKTEQATPKKLRDARKEGQVAKSKELGLCVGILLLFVLLKVWIGVLGNQFLETFSLVYNRIPEFTKMVAGEVSVWDHAYLLREVSVRLLIYLFPFMAAALIGGMVVEIIQVKWEPTAKPLQPKLSKLDPIKGFKKIVSLNSLVEFLKSLFKILIISGIVYITLRNEWRTLFILLDMPVGQAISVFGEITINLGLKISLVYAVLALADFIYQKWKFNKDMMMTKQEIKDEFKQSEGDPKIKGKIRQRMMQASQRRMMQDLPKADVVITNPTHFAVAIKYDDKLYDAPYVVAKGCDHLAAKMKEVARENHVEIVENKPLARMLYHNVELGAVIPPELYKAVADILVMVYKAQGKI